MPGLPSHTAGERTKLLRQRLGLSRSGLAEELTRAGIAWDAETVRAFEEEQRDVLDVQELLAIALVLSVPPIALLVNPTMDKMALTAEVKVPTTYGLLWLVGEHPLHPMTSAWEQDTVAVRLARQLHQDMCRCIDANSALLVIERMAEDGYVEPDLAEIRRDRAEREMYAAFVQLRTTLQIMRDHHISVPRLLDQETLVRLANMRGITLPLPQSSTTWPAQVR